MANRQRAGGRAKKEPRTLRPAPDCPVARVAVDIPLAHLDRPFDYLVPERLAAQALPGVRVRVRFAGQLTDGFILERASASEHQQTHPASVVKARLGSCTQGKENW